MLPLALLAVIGELLSPLQREGFTLHGVPFCGESDLYPGYPRETWDENYGAPRPGPRLLGCSEIHLEDTRLTPRTAEVLSHVISTNTSVLSTLRKLELGGTGIGAAGVTSVATILEQEAATLRYLDLGRAEMGPEGATALAPALARAGCPLTTLKIDWNALGPEGADVLGAALRHNGALRQLFLERNEIGDAGAASVANALATNTALHELVLEGNQIGAVCDPPATRLASPRPTHRPPARRLGFARSARCWRTPPRCASSTSA